MTVVTKFSADREVWYIDHNKATSDFINYIQIMIYPKETIIHYDLRGRLDRKFREKELFGSKEELLQSL